MNRKRPYRHEVKKHTRNGYTVKSYDRGKGKPTPHKTLNSRILSGRSSTITADFIRRLHNRRTPTARKIDESRRAPIAKEYEDWIHAPNKVDVIGVDSAGGFKRVSEIDISKYSDAQLSMNQMGGIYRVDVWDKEGHVSDGPGFRTEKEARTLITAIKNQKKGRSDEEIKLLKRGIEKNIMTTTAIDGIVETIKNDKKLSDEQKKDLTEYAKSIRSTKEKPVIFESDSPDYIKLSQRVTPEELARKMGGGKPRTEATYNLATGWMRIVFDEKPSRETLDKLKAEGFRYRPRSKAWTAKQNYPREKLLESLAGEVKDINIPVDYQRKAEYYAEKASSTKAESDRLYSTAKQKMDMIPFGQPILVGHHSEKRHRSDLKKISRGMEKSFETSDKAQEYAARSVRATVKAEGRENPVTILNRIENLEKELAKTKKQSKTYNRIETRLNIEREKYKKTGGIAADSMTFKIGDKIRTQFGPAIIKKVNKKTLKVDYQGGYQKGKPFWEDRKMDIKDVKGAVPKSSFVDPLIDQYVSSGNNLVTVEVKNKDSKTLLKELSYRISDRGLDNKIKVSQRRDEVYLELVK